jgi:hypothetical protein
MTSEIRVPRGRRRARGRAVAGGVAFVLAIAVVPVLLAIGRGSSDGTDRQATKDPVVSVRAAIGKTVASGSYETDIETHSTDPHAANSPQCSASSCGSSTGYSRFDSSGHGIVNLDPFVVRTDSNSTAGSHTLYVTSTNVWLVSSGTDGPVGPGTPLSTFARSIVSALGPSQGALAAIGLASPGGELNLQEEAVAKATSAGTGSVDGIQVTYFDVIIDMTKLADTPGLSDVQRATIEDMLPLLRQGGYAGTTERVGVDDDGYIREVTATNHFTDGSTGIRHHTLSNFGCAPKVSPPDQQASAVTSAPTCGHTDATATTSPPPTTSSTATAATPTLPNSPSSAGLRQPSAVTVAGSGDVLIADAGRHQVLRRSPDGRVTVIAGTGAAGFSGDHGPAVDAMLNAPRAIAAGPEGTIYVGDTSNDRVRAIDRDGVISTIATLPSPQSLTFGTDGQLLVADNTGVERVETDGSITTVLPAGSGRYVINGTASAFFPSAVTVDGNGDLIVASFSPKYVARFTPDGSFVDAWDDYVAPAGIATGPDGVAYLASYGFFSIERLTATGPVAAVTFTSNSIAGVDGTFRPQGVAVGPDGTIYAITDGGGTTNDRALISIATDGTGTALIVN